MKKETQPQHTQGEWKISKYSATTVEVGDNGRTIASCGGYSSNVIDFTEENIANTKRIVKAVNMHDELIETIQEAKKLFNDFSTHIPVGYSRLKTDWLNFQDKLTKQLLKQSEQI